MVVNETDTQRKCIYCPKSDAISAFNKEHVLQESMTTKQSIQGNLTLEPSEYQNCVCTECNSHFGRTLDLAFGRDSLEGLLRYKHNVKPLSELKNQRFNKTKFRNPTGKDIDPGSELIFRDDGQEDMVARTPSQVRLHNKKTGNFEYFLEKNFPELISRASEFELSSFELHGSPKLSTEEWTEFQKRVSTALQQIGIEQHKFSEVTESGPGICEPITSINLDKDLQQALSKIAFNYLAVILAKLDESLILHSAFDEMRNFIRYGTEPRFEVVSVASEDPISESQRRHLIRLQIAPLNGRMVISCRISVFLSIVWNVILSTNAPIDKTIKAGHLWDLDQKTCKQLYFEVSADESKTLEEPEVFI